MNERIIRMLNVCLDSLATYGQHPIIESQVKRLIQDLQKDKSIPMDAEVILQKTERKQMQPHIKELIIKILFDYYDHGVHTHAIMPASDAQIILDAVAMMIDEKIEDYKNHAFMDGATALYELKESFLSK